MSYSDPWCDAEVARQQRDLNDVELARDPWVEIYTSFVAAFAEMAPEGESVGTVLDVGCSNGIGRVLLDRASIRYDKYIGADVSEHAIALARERYPDGEWIPVTEDVGYRPRGFDVVADTACLMHVDGWEQHLAELADAAREWLVLHRVPLAAVGRTVSEPTKGYGKTFPAWRFARLDLLNEIGKLGWYVKGSYPLPDNYETWLCARHP